MQNVSANPVVETDAMIPSSTEYRPPSLQYLLWNYRFRRKFPTKSGLDLVRRALDLGGNFLDTAHCYSFWVPGGLGRERRAVRGCGSSRDWVAENFVIATKGGHSAVPPDYPRPDAFMSPEVVRQDLTESLDRLDLPQVDIYYLHRDDPRVPVGEVMAALHEHVTSGRGRYLGV